MKPHPTILLLGVALIAMGAAGTIYYETLPGLVIKHPVTGATTATINGTNGTVTAGYFVGDGSGLTGLPSGSSTPVAINPRDATTWLVDMGAGSFQTNAIAGAVTLSVSNCVAGLPVTVILLGTNVSENVTYNVGLTHQASALAPSIPAGYRMIVSLLPQNTDTNQVVISTIVTP